MSDQTTEKTLAAKVAATEEFDRAEAVYDQAMQEYIAAQQKWETACELHASSQTTEHALKGVPTAELLGVAEELYRCVVEDLGDPAEGGFGVGSEETRRALMAARTVLQKTSSALDKPEATSPPPTLSELCRELMAGLANHFGAGDDVEYPIEDDDEFGGGDELGQAMRAAGRRLGLRISPKAQPPEQVAPSPLPTPWTVTYDSGNWVIRSADVRYPPAIWRMK